MRYFYVFILALFVTCFCVQEASARLFTPRECSTTPGHADYDPNCQPGVDNSLGIDQSMDIKDMTYSATWDAALDINNLNFTSIPACIYDRTPQLSGDPAILIVNKFFMNDRARVLFGVKNANACPLPGARVSANYPSAIAGEFLVSGVICVVNSIIFDAMFRIYCTIILWFYNILFGMIIIYVMFYGLFIMFGIGNNPIREAPKRILKIIIIFSLAVNAQIGFRYLHNGFITALNAFSEMLVDMQPYPDESGQPAYKKGLMGQVAGLTGMEILVNQGPLLDENGDKWKTLPAGTEYYDMFLYNYLKNTTDPNITLADPRIKGVTPSLNYSYSVAEVSAPEDYVPFRIPDMQWMYKENPKGSGNYTLYPVFEDTTLGDAINNPANWGGLETYGWQRFRCIADFRWNAAPYDQAGNRLAPRLELYPRCQKNLWPTLPNMLPFGMYCDLKIDNGTNSQYPILEGKIVPDNGGGYCTSVNTSSNNRMLTHPSRLKEPKYGPGGVVDDTTLNDVCGNTVLGRYTEIDWWTCRKPFQGVLTKIDSMFNSILGGDSAKNIGALAIALSLWAMGTGVLLSVLLMTGLLAMLTATLQLIFTYVTALMALTFLLMLSPIFISCALFRITDPLFKGWLRALISYTMQPFLIMAFLFMLSHMTSLDRLAKLAKTELRNKIYIVNGKNSETKVTFSAPSFAEPLYKKPDDFDEYIYQNKNQTGNNSATQLETFISLDQREEYLKKKGDVYLYRWLMKRCDPTGPGLQDAHKQVNVNELKCENYMGFQALFDLWYKGTYEDLATYTEQNGNPTSIPNPNRTKTIQIPERGMRAVSNYMWHHRNESTLVNDQAPGGQANLQIALNIRFRDLIECYEYGCTLGADNSGNYAYGSNCQTDCIDYDGIDPSGNGSSVDDNDSFIGEPESQESWGIKRPEFPQCVKNCPQFRPPYDPSTFQNPSIEPRLTQYPGNGPNCPDLVDNLQPWIYTPDGNPDVCAPNSECVKYCMYVPNGKANNFAYIMGGIIIWVFLNILAATFMSRVPAIAEALASWEGGAGSGVILGGASRMYAGDDQAAAAYGYTSSERSRMTYNAGGLFGLGLVSGVPGAVPALLEKTTRLDKMYRVDPKTGEILFAGYLPSALTRDANAQAKRKQMIEENKKAKKVRQAKQDYLGSADAAVTDQRTMDFGRLAQIYNSNNRGGNQQTPATLQELFSKYRPRWKTGLPHSEIMKIIMDTIAKNQNAEGMGLSTAIEKAITNYIDQIK